MADGDISSRDEAMSLAEQSSPDLVERVAKAIARVTLHDMEGSDPGPISDERWTAMACDNDRVYLENIARAIIPLVREAELAVAEADLTHAYLSGHAKGVVETEAQIVAWLRTADCFRPYDGAEQMHALWSKFADAIERGEHRKESQ